MVLSTMSYVVVDVLMWCMFLTLHSWAPLISIASLFTFLVSRAFVFTAMTYSFLYYCSPRMKVEKNPGKVEPVPFIITCLISFLIFDIVSYGGALTLLTSSLSFMTALSLCLLKNFCIAWLVSGHYMDDI